MPLYEYRCEKCGDLFEVRQKFSDEPLTTHEKCGGPVHRLLSAPALQFKGSGWYITDYAKSGSNGSTKADSSSADKPASGEKKDAPAAASSEKSSTPASSETKSS
ncbi:MAG TPA: FmdB family zinc ribbon protein [Bryobacteraceae bacterium]|jgi:putative FmdB family regulatory protein|nr:FmdB family zinc ribbon protein [Bryobacteraceae bacterium]